MRRLLPICNSGASVDDGDIRTGIDRSPIVSTEVRLDESRTMGPDRKGIGGRQTRFERFSPGHRL
ncbi:MAG: hypothetical protein AAF989_13040 [Planctomycetota bacterium]